MITADSIPLWTRLTHLDPTARRTWAVAGTRHALDAFPDDPHRGTLRTALTEADTAAGRQAILTHPWATRTLSLAHYLIWQSAYWASWPSARLSVWAAFQAALLARQAVAEWATHLDGGYQAALSAEERWQGARLPALC